MTSQFFTYNKGKVIQALRYHFVTRKEIKLLMIVVNVFTILAAGLFFFHKISPFAFLISSCLWFVMMLLFWFLLPRIIYSKSDTFKDKLRVILATDEFVIESERGRNSCLWKDFTNVIESPHFFHLYFNSQSFFIIPKEAFEPDEHEARRVLALRIPPVK
ncbi:MAG: YcxB family protein [Sphingobacteriales bacterium]|nr:YcxB family protein [Sphingobacteriales bacterium]